MLTNTSNNAKNPTVVIGIDHGYGNIKTANTCFRAGVTAYDKEPYVFIKINEYLLRDNTVLHAVILHIAGCIHASLIIDGTMNIMTISNGKPNPQKCYTEKYGTYQCMLSIREQLMRKFGTAIDDDVIDDALRYGTADIGEKYLAVIREVARQYVIGIMRRLREHEYNPELMKLYIVGGGGCLIRHFGTYDPSRVTIDDDICAKAKGYEFLANLKLKKANAA